MEKEVPKNSESNPEDLQSNAIFLMNQFYRLLTHGMEPVDKTIIIYDVYAKGSEERLTNLQSIAAGILSRDVQIQGLAKVDPDDQDKKIRWHSLDLSQLKKNNIDVNFIKVHQGSADEEFPNIRLYHSKVNEQSIRVVTVPIQKGLTNKKQVETINKKLEKFQKEGFQIAKNLQGQKQDRFRQQRKKMKEVLTNEFCQSMKQKHLKMFIIEALLYVIRQKTKLISVCGIMTPGSNDGYEEQLEELFDVPSNARQFIVHTITGAAKQKQFEAKPEFSSVWTFMQQKVTCTKNQCLKQNYFTKQVKGIKTKIYNLMNERNNEYLAKVIEQFIKNWANITCSSSSCIAIIIKKVYQKLEFGEDLSLSIKDANTSLSSDSSKNIIDPSISKSNKQIPEIETNIVAYSFSEIFKKYNISNLKNLGSNSTLQQFYNQERLKGIQVQKFEKAIIPESIEGLTFLHYFYKINQQFCQDYAINEKKDRSALQNLVFNHLKSVYELANGINNSRLLQQQDKCQNMQTYFNFLNFLFQSSTLIKSITGRQLAICGSLKALFDQLKPKENRLLTYILNNEQRIRENEPVHYYDLYLKIIKQNSKGLQNKIQYIYLMIHRFKADKISSAYIFNKKKVVDAIKSYSEIIYKYDSIAESKRDKINKLDIEKKIARLLLVIGLPDEAIRIYQKNHLVKSAEKCFKQIVQSVHGDAKATQFIQFGRYLESEFSFPKAIDYYENAYQSAKSTAMRQESIKRKLDCVAHLMNPKDEEKRLFVRYYNGQSTENEFLNTSTIELGAQDKKSQFSRLRNRLNWDEANNVSVIMEEKSVEEEMIGI